MPDEIRTASQAIDALGGVLQVAILLGKTEQCVWNWRKRGFPAYTNDVLGAQLKAKGFQFTPKLFKQGALVNRKVRRPSKRNGAGP